MSATRQLLLKTGIHPESPPVDLPHRDDRSRRATLGQFFTPQPIADFMASLFETGLESIDLLDAGAGGGSLIAAFVRRMCTDPNKPDQIRVTAYEVDPLVFDLLHETLINCQQECASAGIDFHFTILREDFIASAVRQLEPGLLSENLSRFNAAIVNPPYRKIQSNSLHRRLLRAVGMETSNLYAGFVALITKLLVKNGQLVAITPRSFCNGPYFKPFRKDFLRCMSLQRMHVFDSRSEAFADDAVLQENVIFHAIKGVSPPDQMLLSSSSGSPNSTLLARGVSYQDVVAPDDPEQFIRLATEDHHADARTEIRRLPCSLAELGLTVSTGRVVDFRAKEFLRSNSQPDTVPLIYPCHFHNSRIRWPKDDSRKPNAIVDCEATASLLVPAGHYVLLKRFTAKEEHRRVVASVYDPAEISAPYVGFENHLNYFHNGGQGLPRKIAYGLAAFLNSTRVDQFFREFSGHTQVNATDLRTLRYPSLASLARLGLKIAKSFPDQQTLDRWINEECR